MASGNDDDMTIFDILERCGKILLGDADSERIFVWNGSETFHCFQHGGNGTWYTVDGWMTSEKPASLEEAVDRCRARLSDQLADEACNEVHDNRVDLLKAESAS